MNRGPLFVISVVLLGIAVILAFLGKTNTLLVLASVAAVLGIHVLSVAFLFPDGLESKGYNVRMSVIMFVAFLLIGVGGLVWVSLGRVSSKLRTPVIILSVGVLLVLLWIPVVWKYGDDARDFT